MRRFSIEPGVACATATRPGTPQLPPRPQGGAPVGPEIAPATTPPISKKLPPVAAVPIRKKRVSGAVAARATAVTNKAVAKSKLAQEMPRQPYLRLGIIVSRGETAMEDDSMPVWRLQPALREKHCLFRGGGISLLAMFSPRSDADG